jgi:ADP-ribose pyrophosphatase YjhB (NUDIX family)
MPHIHELFDFVVSVFVVYDSKVLLVNHPKYGKWLPIGGHVELDEDVEQTLFREIQEESGLEVEIINSKPSISSPGTKFLPAPNYLDVHEANAPHKHIALIYFARAKNNRHALSSEHLNMRWLDEGDLEKPEYGLDPAIRFYCQKAIGAAGRTNG